MIVITSALIHIAEAKQSGQVWSESKVALEIKLVAVVVRVAGIRIDAADGWAVVHQRLANCAVSVRALNPHRQPVVIRNRGIVAEGDWHACRIPLRRLFPLARQPVAHQVMPRLGGLVLYLS